MSSSAADASNNGALTRSRLESWPTDHLRDAPAQWRTSARESLQKFEQYQRSVNDTDWTGDGKDAAVDAADRDLNLVKHQHDVIEQMITTATDGHEAVSAAKRDATNAIATAEQDGFHVGEGLTVSDSRKIDISTMADRFRAAKEHAEDIQWHGQRLVETDTAVGDRLRSQAETLRALQFTLDSGGPGEGDRRNAVQAATFKQGPGDLDDLPLTPSDSVYPFPFLPPPPKGSARGGGEWSVDHSQPYQGSGTPTGPPPVKPWHTQYKDPIVGPTSGMKDIITVPTNGWGSKPHVTGQEEYRFRLMGKGFDGAPGHAQWVQQDGKWYPATWVGYDYEVEHVRQMAGQEGPVGGVTMRWGMGEWHPIQILDIYQAQGRNPALTMYLPNPNGMVELSPKDSVARGR